MRNRRKHYVERDEIGCVSFDGNFIATSDTVKQFLGHMGSAHVALRKFSGAKRMKFEYKKTERFIHGFVFGHNQNQVWLCRDETSQLFGISPTAKTFTIWVKKEKPLLDNLQ